MFSQLILSIDFALAADSTFSFIICVQNYRSQKMIYSTIQLAVALSFAYTIYWDLYILKLPGPRTFGGQWKFLTFWNLWIQCIYFTISFLTTIIGSKDSRLISVRDYMFATLGETFYLYSVQEKLTYFAIFQHFPLDNLSASCSGYFSI